MRHGESTWNVSGRFQGHTAHPPLTDRGRQQVRDAVAELTALAPTHVVASPAVRARESAEIVADALGLEITSDDRVVEQGATETLADVLARLESFLADVDPTSRPLVVSHGDTIAIAHARLTGRDVPGPLRNASIVTTP